MNQVPVCDEQHEVCQNGGVCVILSDPKFNFCKCVEGYAGAKCHGQVDNASKISICTEDGNQCQNGGKCILAHEMIEGENVPANYCQCNEGNYGAYCHGTGKGNNAESGKSQLQEAAEAAAEEAFAQGQNQGAPPSVPTGASQPNNGQKDWCTAGGNECQNGAKCILKDIDNNVPANYCECVNGYFGELCKGKHSHLTNTPAPAAAAAKVICTANGDECKNGSKCRLKNLAQGISENHCECVNGFFGEYCKGKHTIPKANDTKNNLKCTQGGNECQNGGVCVPATNQVLGQAEDYCNCPTGTSGDRCETKNACDLKCQHGGSCRNFDDISHADASDKKSGFECDCVGDYKGVVCEIPFTKCPLTSDGKEMECLYGGSCTFREESNEYGCACTKGRSGKYCETGVVSSIEDYNGACNADADCQHGGLCVRSHDAETTEKTDMLSKTTKCLCPIGWGGSNCETRCNSLKCQHGSTCRFNDGDVTHANDTPEANAYCECPNDSYKGKECEIAVVKCPGDNGMECLYGGECIGSQEDEDGDLYSCACPPGRTGVRCEQKDPNYRPFLPSPDRGQYKPPAIATSQSARDIDMNILVVGTVSLAFLLFVPCTIYFLGRNRRRKEAAKATIAESSIDDGSIPTEQNGDDAAANGSPANGVHSEDIFDYDGEGVVNVSLDETEPVALGKDKQIV